MQASAVANTPVPAGKPDEQRAHHGLLGCTPEELSTVLRGVPGGDRPYRARQLFHWLHHRRAAAFEEMSDLPLALRRALAARHQVSELRVTATQRSRTSNTIKLVLSAPDGCEFETVRIETPNRVTLCLSTQVGCGFGCVFCRTATMGLARNLSAGEIVEQIVHAHRVAALPERFNLVFMGMGEPLANYDQLVKATDLISAPGGLAVSPRRITVSTVGLAPQIERLGQDRPRLGLAVSLSATTDEARSRLMPIGRRYPLARLVAAVRRHVELSGRAATFEYVMLAGVNDSLDDARRLARLAARAGCKINLIPYNDTGSGALRPSSRKTMERFVAALGSHPHAVTMRATQGRDILAACGQLAKLPATPRSGARPHTGVA